MFDAVPTSPRRLDDLDGQALACDAIDGTIGGAICAHSIDALPVDLQALELRQVGRGGHCPCVMSTARCAADPSTGMGRATPRRYTLGNLTETCCAAAGGRARLIDRPMERAGRMRADEASGALVLLNIARAVSPPAVGEGDRDAASTSTEKSELNGMMPVLSPTSDSGHGNPRHEHQGSSREFMGMTLIMSAHSATGYAGVDRKVEGGRVWFRAQAPRRLRHIRSHLGRFSSPELAAHAYATFLESPSTYTITDDPRRRKPAKFAPATPRRATTATTPDPVEPSSRTTPSSLSATPPSGKVHKPRRKMQTARASAAASSTSSS